MCEGPSIAKMESEHDPAHDLRILHRAHEVMRDKKRHKAARKHAAELGMAVGIGGRNKKRGRHRGSQR